MKKLITLIISVFIFYSGKTQSLVTENDYLLNGYEKKISGDIFSYHSSVSGVENSLIVRATDGNYSMEWLTSAVPDKVSKKFITIAWLAGIGSSPGLAEMNLSLNNEHIFTFMTDGIKEWKLKSKDGKELFFKSDMEDQHGDNFGFMFLRIPTEQVERDKSFRLKVTGGNNKLTSWYMTFRMVVESGLTIKSYPAIISENGKNKQLLSGNILYFGQPQEASFFVDGKLLKKQKLKFGSNYLRFGIPETEKTKTVKFKIKAGNFSDEQELEQQPVRQWNVNFVQHSHTDIGYTRSQTEILAEHLRYIDYALDYCDLTDNYPDATKFRWTCEASWAVDEFLKSRPEEQIQRLRKRVKEGRIEIAAMYFNFDELPEEQSLAASLSPLKRFKENGITTKMAMQNDVNGIPWCMNDFYHDLGVKYLNMGTHGHRALICFDKPTLFWWESPSGNRMLAYRAEHYMTGNTVFQIEKGDLANFEPRLLNYLTSLGEKGYEYKTISIQHSGYLTDNSPPSTIASDLIRKWNEIYVWPKLKTATSTEFFEAMEKEYSDNFPVYKGAWPDWWTDGFGASAREVASVRKAQTDLTAYSAGLTMAALQNSWIPKDIHHRINLVNNAMLFFTEHTVGYSESVREPYHEQTMEQRAIKESYAWESNRRAKMVGEEVLGLLQNKINKEEKPSLLIFNTLNWTRNGLATIYIDHQIVPRNMQPKVYDEMGNILPVQAVSKRSDGTTWAIWAKNIPPFGYKKLLVEPVLENYSIKSKTLHTRMENKWYKIEVDPKKAVITSWFDKELGKELVDKSAQYGMGEFIYETLGNRYQLEQKRLDNFKRVAFDSAWFDSYTEGEVWNTIHMKGKTAAAYDSYDVDIEIRLFNITKRIDFNWAIYKKPIVEPEGIYIAFPLDLNSGKHYFEVQGGVIEAGKDQIPGSSNDWNTIQNFTALRNNEMQIIFSSQEIPLVQFGAINTGRYKAGAMPESTHFYSWPMNNYWVTNFNPDQKGEHRWSYSLTSEKGTSNTEATKYGWGNRIPFLTRLLPGGGKGDAIKEKSFIQNWPDNILLVNTLPIENQNSVILQVRETGGRNANLSVLKSSSGKFFKISQVNAIGEPIENGSATLKPFGYGFFKLTGE